jgi:hypothetical protein
MSSQNKKRKRNTKGDAAAATVMDDVTLNTLVCPQFPIAAVRKQEQPDLNMTSQALLLVAKLIEHLLRRIGERIHIVVSGDSKSGEHLNPEDAATVDEDVMKDAVRAVTAGNVVKHALIEVTKACTKLDNAEEQVCVTSTGRAKAAGLQFQPSRCVHIIEASMKPFRITGNADICAAAVAVSCRTPSDLKPRITNLFARNTCVQRF